MLLSQSFPDRYSPEGPRLLGITSALATVAELLPELDSGDHSQTALETLCEVKHITLMALKRSSSWRRLLQLQLLQKSPLEKQSQYL